MANFKHISIDGTSYDAVPSGSYVTGVKGNSETTYRSGNVNITKTNIGLGNVPNVSTNNQAPTFTQATTRANIASGETLTTIFGKIMKFFADLKTVAFSGSYTDLSDKPTIPTVNNATLTIQKNGTNVQTFTANASANKTANITVPTKVSELTNDSGYTTNTGTVTQVKVGTTAYDPSSGVVSLPAYPTVPTVNNATLTIQKNGTNVQTFTANASSNKTANITVPTKVSELTNDSGFITDAGVTGVKGNSETTYRSGNVNITKTNIGLGNVPNVSTNNQAPTFTQATTRANIASGETLTTILGKIMKWYADLKTVAFSGSYTDLSDKPTIPTVNNGTLTIQKNGTNVQTFTANQSTNATANITVPTVVNNLTSTSTTNALSAAQGKKIWDEFNLLGGTKTFVTVDSNFMTDFAFNSSHIDEAIVFSNWSDATNFPAKYGSGIMFPCVDQSLRYLIYVASSHLYIGIYQQSGSTVTKTWTTVK